MSRPGRIFFLPVLEKQMSCGECCRALSLPAGSEHSCLKFPRRKENGWNPLRPLTPAPRSWRIWTDSISAEPGCWRELLLVYRRTTSDCGRSWRLPRDPGGLGWGAGEGKSYEGGHWLGSFAVYLVTKRGISR